MLLALEGIVGYGMGGARVEIEIGYERFPIQGVSGGKGDDGDAVFLLAKELANDVVRDRTQRLSDAIHKVARKDMHRFAKAIEIDTKTAKTEICKDMAGSTGSGTGAGQWVSDKSKLLEGGTDYCGCWGVTSIGANGEGSGKQGICSTATDGSMSAAVKKARSDKAWSELNGTKLENENKTVDDKTAKVISTGIEKLDKEEKSKVASAFAKTIEGAEVVEVKAVTSTSVIVNACYDLINDSIGVVPYACVGIGGNFVGVVM